MMPNDVDIGWFEFLTTAELLPCCNTEVADRQPHAQPAKHRTKLTKYFPGNKITLQQCWHSDTF